MEEYKCSKCGKVIFKSNNKSDEIVISSYQTVCNHCMGFVGLVDEIRLLKQYHQTKLREITKTMNMIIDFARDDLKKLDELNEKIKSYSSLNSN